MIFKNWKENKELQLKHYEKVELILNNIYKQLVQIKNNTIKTERRILRWREVYILKTEDFIIN